MSEPESEEPVICKCGKPGVLGECPFQADVYNDPNSECSCCEECRHDCLMDI